MIYSDLVNIEYKGEQLFPRFQESLTSKKVFLVCDQNTEKFADTYINWIHSFTLETKKYVYLREFLPNEEAIDCLLIEANCFDYILAVGSGTLNDLCKYVGKVLNIPTGILATAPSMDGYLSTGSALIMNHTKVTKVVDMPKDILVDLDILVHAPREMIVAGYGDIIGKFTSLADWKLANICNGEVINRESYEMMEDSLNKTVANITNGEPFSKESIENLMDALNVAGISMAIAGNSRPASGSEHHMSHFLEIYFLNHKMPAIAHGVKVALGSLVSLELYKRLLKNTANDDIIDLIKQLPDSGIVYELLKAIGSPLKFKAINVERELFSEMFFNAHRMRDRFTILSYYHKNELMDKAIGGLIEKFID